EIPTFVIFSKDDPVIDPEAIYKEVLPNLSKPSVTALSNIGHLIPMEAPRKLARQIRRITRG
ncbi:alpha/beta fold hydrolase, partial [Pricia sp.]|uniref:alpha/beta fold hydrolase n=1 Tax=Pricia sp. TaxID=2268138 RepID=UPI003593644A